MHELCLLPKKTSRHNLNVIFINQWSNTAEKKSPALQKMKILLTSLIHYQMTKSVPQQLLLDIIDEKSVYPRYYWRKIGISSVRYWCVWILTIFTAEIGFSFTSHCRGLRRTASFFVILLFIVIGRLCLSRIFINQKIVIIVKYL